MKAVAVMLIIALVACAPAQAPKQAAKAAPVAMLAVQSGEVFVNDSPASAGMELKEGDTVKTGAKSKASLVFFDSSILRLNENTEIVVKDIVSQGDKKVNLEQTAGQTWSRVLKISGIKEYSIETPNTVATVRGTGFAVSIGDGDTIIAVKEGKVLVAAMDENQVVAEAVVPANMELEVTDEAPAGLELAVLEPDLWVDENIIADDQFIGEVVDEYIEENPDAVADMTEEEAYEYAEDMVMVGEQPVGELTPDEVVEEMHENIVEGAQEIAEMEREPVEETVVEEVVEQLPEEPVVVPVSETPLDQQLIDESAADQAVSDLNTLN